jgi:tetratricopeptide (TPR) repeat protein
MSEPLRTDPTTEREGSSPAASAVQIERLLLSGLDLYFAGQYQEAVNVWTRVAFLERGHGRARAYIDRARTAIAEQQRQSEELFHQGRDAYNGGNIEQARQLLSRVIEQGGSSDEALLLLQQLNRFSPVASPLAQPGQARTADVADAVRVSDGSGWVRIAGAVALTSALALLAAPVVSWFGDAPVINDVARFTPEPIEALPIVRSGDLAYENARQLYAGGHLADALRALERIDIGDPVRAQAEGLKGDIQRDLLATVRQARPLTGKGTQR